MDIYFGDKKIGAIEGETFRRRVSGKHILQRPKPAWAIQAEQFDQLIKPRCTTIEFIEDEWVNRISVEDFDRYKMEIDFGFGRQYAVQFRHWERAERLLPRKPRQAQDALESFADATSRKTAKRSGT